MPLCVLSLLGFGTSGLVASADNNNLGWFKDWLSKLRGRHNLGTAVWGLCNQITCFRFPELSFLSNSMWQASVCPEDCDLEINSHFFPKVPEKCFSFCCLLLEPHSHPRVIHTGWEEAKADGAWSGAEARDGPLKDTATELDAEGKSGQGMHGNQRAKTADV